MAKNSPSPIRVKKYRFHAVIARADRIVVRDGGYDCCGPVDGQKVFFEVTDPEEIAEVYEHLHVVAATPSGGCLCCGHPGIDWYRGNTRIALTGIQHGRGMRWREFPGDAYFTTVSAAWLDQWLASHEVSPSSLE